MDKPADNEYGNMNKYYVDLHVHIGRSSGGREIKKAMANNLTFENIAAESYCRKGNIVLAREGKLNIEAGGGGVHGKIE